MERLSEKTAFFFFDFTLALSKGEGTVALKLK